MKKYKKFRGRRWKAIKWLSQIARREPGLFPHWQYIRSAERIMEAMVKGLE